LKERRIREAERPTAGIYNGKSNYRVHELQNREKEQDFLIEYLDKQDFNIDQ
jgi:hypothetical protein